MAAENHDALMLAIQEIFYLTLQEAKVLLVLVQHEQVPHARVDIDRNVLTVRVCSLRKQLHKYKVSIKTLWGYGYQIGPEDRKRLLDLILNKACASS